MDTKITTAAEMLAVVYSQFNAFCAVIIGILLWATVADTDRADKRVHLANVLVSVIIYCIVDSLWSFVYNDIYLPRTFLSRYITNILLYLSMGLCSYTIFRFLISLLKLFSNAKSRYVFIPFGAIMLLTLTTPWTHLLFTITPSGDFVKGKLYFLLMMVMFGYVILFALMAFAMAFRAGNEESRSQYLIVTVYAVPIVIGALIHYSVYTMPTFSVGFTIATLIIYIFQMRDQVSLDALTGINNRKQGERFFLKHIREQNEGTGAPSMGGLYLFMMDLNKFKQINDVYGHTEGDKALVATADALKEACTCVHSRCILSRFGGDEFVIGAMLGSEEEAVTLYQKILELLAKKNESLAAPYELSISIGYEKYKKSYKTLKAFLAAADKKMYAAKKQSKSHAIGLRNSAISVMIRL